MFQDLAQLLFGNCDGERTHARSKILILLALAKIKCQTQKGVQVLSLIWSWEIFCSQSWGIKVCDEFKEQAFKSCE